MNNINTINNISDIKKITLITFAVSALLIAACLGGCKNDVDDGILGAGPVSVLPAPGKPAVTPAENQLTVQWDAVEGASSYEVWLNTTFEHAAAERYGDDIDETSTVIADLDNGTEYFVWVKAKSGTETSAFSPRASGTPSVPVSEPSAPGQPAAIPGDRQIALRWNAVEGASSYEIWLSTTNDSGAAERYGGDVNGIRAIVTGLANDTLYYVWVKAKNGLGTSTFSPAASGTPVAPPAAPDAAPSITGGNGELTAEWDAVSGAESYEVWINTTDNSGTAERYGGDVNGTNVTITGLTNARAYYIWVKAKNSAGTSTFSPMAIGMPGMIFQGLQLTINTGGADKDFILPIKKEVNGIYLNINWGDGATETVTTAPTEYYGIPHTYPALDTDYTISLTGSCKTDLAAPLTGKCGFGFTAGSTEGYNSELNKSKIVKAEGNISALSTGAPSEKNSYKGLFYNCANLDDISGLVFAETNAGDNYLSSAFEGCTSLASLPANFLPNITSAGNSALAYAFSGCTALVSVPSGFMSNITSTGDSFLSRAFSGCTDLVSLPSGFLPNITNPSAYFLVGTFENCTKIKSLPGNFLPNVTAANGMLFLNSTFSGCTALEGLALDFLSNITSAGALFLYDTFSGCTALKSLPAGFLINIAAEGGSFLRQTFSGCTALETLPGNFLSKITIAEGGFLERTFSGCTALKSIPSGFLSNVTAAQEIFLYSTFSGCEALENIPHNFLPSLNAGGDQFMRYVFNECGKLNYIDLFSDSTSLTIADSRCMASAFQKVAKTASTPLILRIHGTTVLQVYESAGLGGAALSEIQVAPELVAAYRGWHGWTSVGGGIVAMHD